MDRRGVGGIENGKRLESIDDWRDLVWYEGCYIDCVRTKRGEENDWCL